MPTQANLMGSGNSALCAQASVGMLTASATATGSNQATALLMPTDLVVFTTVAASTGTILPATALPGDTYVVVNHGASSLSVYPPTGGKVGNGSTNAAFAVGVNKTAYFMNIGANTFSASLSA